MAKKDKRLLVYMTEEVYEQVIKQAKSEMMTKSGFVMYCVMQELKRRKAWDEKWR